MLLNSTLATVFLTVSMAAPPPPDSGITLTSAPVTHELTLPELGGPRDHYALRVVGITVAANNPALFRVFVELPTADRSTPSNSEHYVGQASILAGPSTRPKNVIMPLNWPHQRNLSAGSKLRFTLVPLAATSASPIHIQRLEITTTHS